MIEHASSERAGLRRVYHQYPITRYGYTLLAYVQGFALLSFVVSNWKENHAASTAAWALWAQVGGYAFKTWGAAWLLAILLAGTHFVYLLKHGDDEARRHALRLLNGFIYFPPFIAVVGYLPVYVLIGLAAGLFARFSGAG